MMSNYKLNLSEKLNFSYLKCINDCFEKKYLTIFVEMLRLSFKYSKYWINVQILVIKIKGGKINFGNSV